MLGDGRSNILWYTLPVDDGFAGQSRPSSASNNRRNLIRLYVMCKVQVLLLLLLLTPYNIGRGHCFGLNENKPENFRKHDNPIRTKSLRTLDFCSSTVIIFIFYFITVSWPQTPSILQVHCIHSYGSTPSPSQQTATRVGSVYNDGVWWMEGDYKFTVTVCTQYQCIQTNIIVLNRVHSTMKIYTECLCVVLENYYRIYSRARAVQKCLLNQSRNGVKR